MPRVLNKRTDQVPEDAVYVGRPSKWGNPYRIDKEEDSGGRSSIRSMDRFRRYILGEIKDGRLDISELKGKDLVCECAPLSCHADILLKLANDG